MSYNAQITITQFGSEVGPFDLYSDVDNYVVPFETNIPLTALTAGYFTANVPDGTTQIKIQSDGDCVNFIIIPVQGLPSPSVTPSNTPSQTPSVTPTITPSPTSTGAPVTPSITPSNTPTMTVTPSGCLRTYSYSMTANTNTLVEWFDIDGILNDTFLTAGQTYTIPCLGAREGSVTGDVVLVQGALCYDSCVPPSATPTPSVTATPGLSPSPTATATMTPTPSTTPPSGGQLFIYARYINSSQEFGYSLNGGSYLGIGEPTSSSCLYVATISGLVPGDTLVFTTIASCSINGDSADCPNSTTGCSYTHNFVGTTYLYITVDASNCC